MDAVDTLNRPLRLKSVLDTDGRHHSVPIMADWDCETGPYHPLIGAVYHGRGHANKATAEAIANLFAAAPALLKIAVWYRDALDLGSVKFYEKHGFNVADIMPRTRAAIERLEAGKSMKE